jgi:hypothetical protein
MNPLHVIPTTESICRLSFAKSLSTFEIDSLKLLHPQEKLNSGVLL